MFDELGLLGCALLLMGVIAVTPWWGWVLIILGGLLYLVFSDGFMQGGGDASGELDEKENRSRYNNLTDYNGDDRYYIDKDGKIYKQGGEGYQIGYIDKSGYINKIGSDWGKVGFIDSHGDIRNNEGLSVSRHDSTTRDKIDDIGTMIEGWF